MAITGYISYSLPIGTVNTTDNAYVTDPQFGLGGVRSVGTTADRDGIKNNRRQTGMIVYVQGENKYYSLVGSTGNTAWTEFKGESVMTTTAPTNQTVGGIAEGVTLTNLTAISILNKMLFPYEVPTFTGFDVGLTTTKIFEMGQTASAAGTYPASWTGNNLENITASDLVISKDGVSITSGFTAGSSPKSVTHAAYKYSTPAKISFQLTGTDIQSNVVTSNTDEYSWKPKYYWGATSGNMFNCANAICSTAGDASATMFNTLSKIQTMVSGTGAFVGGETSQMYVPTVVSFTPSWPTPQYLYFILPQTVSTGLTSVYYQSSGGSPTPLPVVGPKYIDIQNSFGVTTTYGIWQSSNSRSYFNAFGNPGVQLDITSP